MDQGGLRKSLMCFSALARFLVLLTAIQVPLTSNDVMQKCPIIMPAFMTFHQFVFLLMALAPPVISDLSLRDRLFFGFHGHDYYGKDVFTDICQQRYLFWLNTGETPETFLQIVYQTAPRFFKITRNGNPRQRLRQYKLSITNRLLLIFIWVRKYPHLDTISLMFDVSPQTASALLYQGLGVLWHHFRSEISWPSIREWNSMRGAWQKFPNTVGCIDVTPHEIQIPSNEPQREFYSGHRHYHLLNTQMICDNNGHIRFLQAGFLGSTHDSLSYRLMVPLGPGLALDVPLGVTFLADKGFADTAPLLTPFRQAQIRRLCYRQRNKARRFNQEHSRKRIKIEHIFKNLKDYNCTTGIWRHPRWLLPSVIELCTFLTERRLTLFQEI